MFIYKKIYSTLSLTIINKHVTETLKPRNILVILTTQIRTNENDKLKTKYKNLKLIIPHTDE